MAAPPTTFAIDDLAAAVAAIFAEWRVTAKVLIGNWKQHEHSNGDRVILGLGKFTGDAPREHYAPGAWITVNDQGDVARATDARHQDVLVWVHGAAPASMKEPERSREAERVAGALLDRTIAAMRRAHGGLFTWGNGDWPGADGQPYKHGALATFVARFRIPIFDEALATGDMEEFALAAAVQSPTDEEVVTTPAEESVGPEPEP
jgi:hypothetical protein